MVLTDAQRVGAVVLGFQFRGDAQRRVGVLLPRQALLLVLDHADQYTCRGA